MPQSVGPGFLNLDAAERLPICERLRTKHSRVRCMQMMTAESEDIVDDAVNGKKPLRLFRRLEPSHLPLTLPGWLMRYLCSIVSVSCCVVWYGRHDGATSSSIATKSISHEANRGGALTFQ